MSSFEKKREFKTLCKIILRKIIAKSLSVLENTYYRGRAVWSQAEPRDILSHVYIKTVAPNVFFL